MFLDAVESRTSQWRLPYQGDFSVSFVEIWWGKLPLLMNAGRLREAPKIHSATRVGAPHYDWPITMARQVRCCPQFTEGDSLGAR